MHDPGAERLADEARALGHVTGRRVSLAGGYDDRDVRPAPRHLAGEVKPVVVSRHLNVGEEERQPGVMVPQETQGQFDVGCVENLEARILQHADRVHADQGVIIDHQGHGRVRIDHP